jgi:hypothetical protein
MAGLVHLMFIATKASQAVVTCPEYDDKKP